MKKIVIIGASGHGKVVVDAAEKTGLFHVIGFLDRAAPTGTEVFGYPVLGREEDFFRLRETHSAEGLVIAIGDNYSRYSVYQRLFSIDPNLPLCSVVHPSATVGRGVTIGAGSVLLAGSIVNADGSVGKCCIINTNASLGHDASMRDFSSLAPACAIGGDSSIGFCSAVSIGACIVHAVHIGDHTVIGAGSTVVSDIPSNVVAYGTPARVVRGRPEGTPYLVNQTDSVSDISGSDIGATNGAPSSLLEL